MSESAFGVDHGDFSKGLPSALRVTVAGAAKGKNYNSAASGYKTARQNAHLNGKVAAKLKAKKIQSGASGYGQMARDRSRGILGGA